MTVTTLFVDHETLTSFAEARVNLPKAEVDAYRGQVQRLREKLKKYVVEHPTYSLIKTLHSGSVAKGTALKSVSDMDVAAYLDASLVPAHDESKLVAELAAILRTAYVGSKSPEDFEEQAHSVKVHFHGSGLDVDVVPVVYDGLPDDRGDLISKYGDRVETSIPLHLQFIRARKTAHGHDYAQVVRFMKYWARQQKRDRGDVFQCKSFLLELIVAHLADDGLQLSDYPTALEQIFAWMVRTTLSERVWFADYHTASDLIALNHAMQVIDPVNPKNNVCATYTATDKANLLEAANDALDAISAARYGTSKSYAVECWQEMFGPTFRGGT